MNEAPHKGTNIAGRPGAGSGMGVGVSLLLVSKGWRLWVGRGPQVSAHRPVSTPRTGPLTPIQKSYLSSFCLHPFPSTVALNEACCLPRSDPALLQAQQHGPDPGWGSGNAEAPGPQVAFRLWPWEASGGRGVLPTPTSETRHYGGGLRVGVGWRTHPQRPQKAWGSAPPGLIGFAAAITMATRATRDWRASDESWKSGAGSGRGSR